MKGRKTVWRVGRRGAGRPAVESARVARSRFPWVHTDAREAAAAIVRQLSARPAAQDSEGSP